MQKSSNRVWRKNEYKNKKLEEVRNSRRKGFKKITRKAYYKDIIR